MGQEKISTISMTTEAEQALFPQILMSPRWTAQDPICHLLWGVSLRIKSLGVPLNVGRLVPGTTFGDKAQITKPGINEIGALEN